MAEPDKGDKGTFSKAVDLSAQQLAYDLSNVLSGPIFPLTSPRLPSVHSMLTSSAVSWNWGSGAPGGTVAEKKAEGEVSITSKRGNKIKKKASPEDPAVVIERPGNNVVKKASELNIEKKSSGGSGKMKGEKRKKDEAKEEEDKGEPTVENEQGKKVRPSGKKQKKEDEKKGAVAETNGETKGRGRPKGAAGGSKKEQKPSKLRDVGTVSARTRSQNK